MKSGIVEVVSEICRRTEATIVLGGAAVFSTGDLQHTLNSCGARYKLCAENVAESHPLPADVERLSTDEVTKLIAVTERVILF
jgi:hypothetical protein